MYISVYMTFRAHCELWKVSFLKYTVKLVGGLSTDLYVLNFTNGMLGPEEVGHDVVIT